ncbi:hypothetical protein AGMMS5026_03540 [Endomicrobiia bacterium]|nr:hypothetical protein AGMMS49523_04860 [Endomicrobiia bacterium]GHT13698.1 hypothetical protein AGMMS49571_07910 [Endomicrobiia bacterium]GHT19068.1 hypothetical protein AGMMS49929_01980 [Endomicrobiia bacterium]GHT28491.1 hypothetical protein AGMMS49995_09410 [Endomicrobiia bacterium]GHT30141.1 hypothetical protein AGMMS5026_03540 [Endomicrobiia bacterium]
MKHCDMYKDPDYKYEPKDGDYVAIMGQKLSPTAIHVYNSLQRGRALKITKPAGRFNLQFFLPGRKFKSWGIKRHSPQK